MFFFINQKISRCKVTQRSEVQQRVLEFKSILMTWIASKVFTFRQTGIDGFNIVTSRHHDFEAFHIIGGLIVQQRTNGGLSY